LTSPLALLWPTPFHPRIAVSELSEQAALYGAVATALTAAQEQVFARKHTSPAGGQRIVARV